MFRGSWETCCSSHHFVVEKSKAILISFSLFLFLVPFHLLYWKLENLFFCSKSFKFYNHMLWCRAILICYDDSQFENLDPSVLGIFFEFFSFFLYCLCLAACEILVPQLAKQIVSARAQLKLMCSGKMKPQSCSQTALPSISKQSETQLTCNLTSSFLS